MPHSITNLGLNSYVDPLEVFTQPRAKKVGLPSSNASWKSFTASLPKSHSNSVSLTDDPVLGP